MQDKATNETGEGTKNRILAAAYELFYRRGFVRVALEEIADKAGVTKRTLYYHFRSKDDLLAAALEQHSKLALARIRTWYTTLPDDPMAAIDMLFAELARWAADPQFEGGGYTRLVMELADLPGHPARAVARRHKATIENWLKDELSRRNVSDPSECARKIALLFEGAMVLSLVHGDPTYAGTAADMARRVVRENTETS
jgi:AcrR family transcriptional regulator